MSFLLYIYGPCVTKTDYIIKLYKLWIIQFFGPIIYCNYEIYLIIPWVYLIARPFFCIFFQQLLCFVLIQHHRFFLRFFIEIIRNICVKLFWFRLRTCCTYFVYATEIVSHEIIWVVFRFTCTVLYNRPSAISAGTPCRGFFGTHSILLRSRSPVVRGHLDWIPCVPLLCLFFDRLNRQTEHNSINHPPTNNSRDQEITTTGACCGFFTCIIDKWQWN